MSILGKKWIIQNSDQKLSTLEKIIENRGFSDEEDSCKLHDPSLFCDMEKAISRIEKAIENEERIIIFGDYDVDGITGTAILAHVLKELKAHASYRIPNRLDDGYGLSEKFIDEFIKKDIKLIITVDCGISCKNEIAKANKNGIDTIITDHHDIPAQNPEAHAIIHPKLDNNYPYRDLTGSGVAFKLAQALIQKHFPKKEQEEALYSLIDLASLGTVADLGPLRGENRFIVKEGLKRLQNTSWKGLKQLMNLALIKEDDELSTITIGYKIAPRINAAGRIGDPYTALVLLLQKEEGEKLQILSKKLEELNINRREMTENALSNAEAHFLDKDELPPLLIANNPDWHVGILGLIAGRLTEKYARPTIIMQDFGDELVASARSPQFFNIVEAIKACSSHLVSFGGHAQAAGFNLKKENLDAFTKEIELYTAEKLKNVELKPVLEVDCEIDSGELNFEFLDKLQKLKPFGVSNARPIFVLSDIEPLFIGKVGKDQNHLKFSIQAQDRNIKVIAFNMGKFADELRQHKKIDLAFNLERNRWNEKDYLQLKALDFRSSKE